MNKFHDRELWRSKYITAKKLLKAALLFLGAALMAVAFAGCSGSADEDEKTVISVLYYQSFENLEKLVEETYSDIDFQFEMTGYASEQMRRLEKSAGPELLLFKQPSHEIAAKFLLDIGDTEASTAYDGTVMKPLQMDGTIYLLPLPGQFSGYIINETMFENSGIAIPETNRELIDALTKLKAAGTGTGEDEINFAIYSDYNAELGMYYLGCMVPDFLGTMTGVGWLTSIRNGEGGFSGVWESMFGLTDRMIDAGLLDTAAMSKQRNSINCQARMANGTLAAVFGSSAMLQDCIAENRANVEAGTASEYTYRMLPLMSDEGNEPWIVLAPSAYIAINAALTGEKLDAARRVMELISTQEGQNALMMDLQVGYSYLHGHDYDAGFIPNGLETYVESGYIYNVQFPDRIIEYLGSQARKVLAGQSTAQECLEAVDKYYLEGSAAVDYDLSVVGIAGETMLLQNYNVRREETGLGNLIADSIALLADVPVAVANGGGIRGSLYEGEITGEDLSAVCPFDNLIVVLEMTGETMYAMLENGLTALKTELPGGRFLQVSGISYTFDSSKPAGERLVDVRLADGSPVEPGATYQVAVNNYMAGSQGYAEGNGDGYVMLNCYDSKTPTGNVTVIRETEFTYRDALAYYFEAHRDTPVVVRPEGRITDIG